MELPGGLPPPDAPMPYVVRVEVSAENQVQWDGAHVADRVALESLLQAAALQSPAPEIHVHADAKAKYDSVAAILTAAQRQGLQKIGVVGLEAYAGPGL
jgi:biopolymer transport protein ExbD